MPFPNFGSPGFLAKYKPQPGTPPPLSLPNTPPPQAYQSTAPFRAGGLPAAAAKGGFSLGGVGKGVLADIALQLFFPPPAGDNYYDRNPKNPPPSYKLQPPEPPQQVEPPTFLFKGGQSRAYYRIDYTGQTPDSKFYTHTIYAFGPIRATGNIYSDGNPPNIFGLQNYGIFRYDGAGDYGYEILVSQTYNKEKDFLPYTNIVNITRVDNQPDTGGDPPPISAGSSSPAGNSLGAPSAAPPSAAPAPAPKPPSPFGSPSGAPGGSPSGSPSGAPGGSPSGFPSPSPSPNPGPTPQPNKDPGSTPSPSPTPTPNGSPGPTPGAGVGPAPNRSPTPNGAPKIGPSPFFSPPPVDPTKYPDTGFQPKIFQPDPLVPNPLTPTPLDPSPKKPNQAPPLSFAPNPGTGNPEPKAPPVTPPPTTPQPPPKPDDDLFEKIKNLLVPIGIGLVGLTGAVQPEKLREAANAGSCQSFAPGGCNADIRQNTVNAARDSANNGKLLAAIMPFLQSMMALLQGIQTALLIPIKAGVELVNTKLGPLMRGADGISGFLGRVSTSMGVDRALNLIAIAANLHNAMMLSANLKVTLLEMLSSVGNATGVLETPDGENVDLNQVFNAGIETVLIKILGVDSYAGLKVGLRKYNAIYQAATNSLNAMSSMFNSMGNVIEQGAEYTGKIGNSLKGAGVVVENAYQWMSEKFDTKSNKFIKFQTTIGDVTQVLETVNEIASSVVEGQQAATEFQKANKEFVEAVENAKKNTGIENKAVKEEAEKAKASLVADPTGEDETGLLSFLTDL